MIREDDIGFGGYTLIQDDNSFCYGVDAVILSDFVNRNVLKKGLSLIDLGTNNGVIPLILSSYGKDYNIKAIEVRKESFELCKENIIKNNLIDKIEAYNLDVKDAVSFFGKGVFDIVVTNPPYFEKGKGIENLDNALSIARTESSQSLKDFLSVSSKLLKPKGELYMIHRPNRLVDIFEYSREVKLEPKVLRFVSPDIDKEPTMVLLKMVKLGGKELKIIPNLLIRENGDYSKEILKIYGKEV